MSDVRFEKQDANPWTVARFGIGLGAIIVVVAAILVWFLVLAKRREEASDAKRPALYFSNENRQPPGVRLQTTPFADLQALHEREREELTTYGWVGQQAGVVRIPVDRAMDLYAQRQAAAGASAGAGTWPPQDEANPPDQPTDGAPVPSPRPEVMAPEKAPPEHGGEK